MHTSSVVQQCDAFCTEPARQLVIMAPCAGGILGLHAATVHMDLHTCPQESSAAVRSSQRPTARCNCRGAIGKKTVLENLDLVLITVDEICDDGCDHRLGSFHSLQWHCWRAATML